MEYDDFLDFVLFVCSSRNTKKQQNSLFFGVSAAADEQSEIKKIVIFHNHLFPSSNRNPSEAHCSIASPVLSTWHAGNAAGSAFPQFGRERRVLCAIPVGAACLTSGLDRVIVCGFMVFSPRTKQIALKTIKRTSFIMII